MLALFMDSSVSSFNIALLKDGKTVDALQRQADRNMTEFAVHEVESISKRNGFDYKDLTDIYVTTGPGSFTSLRIALLIAKTIISVHRHIALWSASSHVFQLGGRNGISLIDARSHSWYVAVQKNGKVTEYDRIVSDDELKQLQQNDPELPVWTNLQEDGLLENLNERLKSFKKSDDYKKVVATYVKPAFGK